VHDVGSWSLIKALRIIVGARLFTHRGRLKSNMFISDNARQGHPPASIIGLKIGKLGVESTVRLVPDRKVMKKIAAGRHVII
jgi:hypothetical protein